MEKHSSAKQNKEVNNEVSPDYYQLPISPIEFIETNKIPFSEGNVIKYICRHSKKGKLKDLEKAKQYIDLIIQRDYAPKEEAPEEEGFKETVSRLMEEAMTRFQNSEVGEDALSTSRKQGAEKK